MRWYYHIIFLLAGLSAAQAQSPRIDRVEIVRAGILKAEGTYKIIPNSDISVGHTTEVNTRFVKQTTVIPARNGTIFGAEFSFIGSASGKSADVTIVWRYPQPGLKNPDVPAAKFIDSFTTRATLGQTSNYYWTLEGDWTLVPGPWILEIWQGDRPLASQEFTLVK